MSTIFLSAAIGIVSSFIVAVINNRMQFFGTVRIYSTLSETIDGSRYSMECICYNSKTVPVYLTNFHVEIKVKGRKKPIIIKVMKVGTARAENENTDHAIITGAYIPPKPQIVQPKVMHDFKFDLGIYHEAVKCFPLKLVAYNEKHRRKTFNLNKGIDLRKEKGQSRKHYESVMNDWLNKNPA